MGLFEREDESVARQKRIADGLVIPRDSSLPMREMREEHLVSIVRAHNSAVDDRLHFLATREIRSQEVREWSVYIPNPTPSGITRVIESRKVDLEEIVQAVTGSLAFRLIDDNLQGLLAHLGSAHFVEVYGRALLRLRSVVLPDPSDIS